MESIDLRPNLDAAPIVELEAIAEAGNLLDGTITHMGILPNGTTTGSCALVLLVRTPEGKTVIGQTTLSLFAASARGLLASPLAAAEGHSR